MQWVSAVLAAVFPLHLIGWEPIPTLPSTYGLDEDILANGLVGSMISDYFWSVHAVQYVQYSTYSTVPYDL